MTSEGFFNLPTCLRLSAWAAHKEFAVLVSKGMAQTGTTGRPNVSKIKAVVT